MTASVDHWVGLWFFVIVPLSFGHPQQTPPPNPGKAAQVHLPRATQSSGPSSTQSIFQRDLALTFQPTVLPTANADCSLLSSIFRSCNSESPGFYTMDPYQQEQCFCASSSYWNPTTFLDAASNCALFVSTEAPSIYSQISIFSSLDYDYCALIFRTIWPYSTSENVASTTSGFGATGTPTITPLPVPIGNIQNFTHGQIAGVSVGCGLTALLAGFGLFVGCRRKRKQESETVEGVDGSFPPTEKGPSIKEKTPSVSELPRGQSVEIHDGRYVPPARVTI